jgi:DNA-binding IclR family transcriptional regulator
MATSKPVRRLANIIDALAASRDGLTLVEIAKRTNLPLSTAHRTTTILMDIGYVSLDPATKIYRLGSRLHRVFMLSVGLSNLKSLARPVLVALAEDLAETSYTTRLTSSGIELIDFCLPTHGSRTLVHPGFEFPIHATAAGKAVYAFQPKDLVKAELDKAPLEKFMPNTIVDKRAVRSDLAKTRARGYAINDMELDPGVFAVAAPIRLADAGVIGAVALCGIKDRMLQRNTLSQVTDAILAAAEQVSRLTHKVVRDDESTAPFGDALP